MTLKKGRLRFLDAMALAAIGATLLLYASNAARDPKGAAARPAADPSRSLLISFVGDIMAHPINYSKRPYSAIYEAVSPLLREADLNFANIETTVDDDLPFAGWPRFNVHSSYVKAAIEAGFDVFSVANNHISDYGAPGIRRTLDALSELSADDGIVFSGIRAEATDPIVPVTIRKNGWTIGYLAITEFLNENHGDGLVNLIDYRDPKTRKRFIDYLREVTPAYDLFILSVHGGIQYDLAPEPAKEAFFREALGAGVDIVWSQHPHVLEPWEIVRTGATRKLIMYSAGNFISGQTSEIDPKKPWLPRTLTGDSAIFRVRVARAPEGGATVASVDSILVTNYKNSDGEMVVRPLATLARARLPPPWGAYYRYRYRAMRSLLARTALSPVQREFLVPTPPAKEPEPRGPFVIYTTD